MHANVKILCYKILPHITTIFFILFEIISSMRTSTEYMDDEEDFDEADDKTMLRLFIALEFSI
jgi:hypothetical protein